MGTEPVGKKCGRWLSAVLPHFLMAYSWMLLTFFVIHLLNPAMSFLDSKISQQFELLYAGVTVACTVSSFCGKRLRIPAAIALAVVIAFVVPVFPALVRQAPELLDTVYFRAMACAAAVSTLAYSIAEIAVMRIRAKKSSAS